MRYMILALLVLSQSSFAEGLNGKYFGKGDGSKNSLEVTELSGGKIKFSAETASNNCTGSIENETATVQNGVAVFNGESDCKLSISFNGGKATVTEESCSFYHGASCSFDANYTKKEAKAPIKANSLTVIVARNSVGAGEDGFSFKSTKGKQYYVSYNSDNMVKGADFIDDKSKKPICLTFEEPNSDHIIEVTRGVVV